MHSTIDLTTLFTLGLSPSQCREVCEAASGYKVSRLNLYPHHLGAIGEWCGRHGLQVAVADFGVREFVEEEGKGGWSNVGRRVRVGEGLRFVYLGRSASEVERAKAAEASEDFSPWVMGDVLRIPRCCTEFFVREKVRALRDYADDYVFLTTHATPGSGPFPWQANYLGQYFGYSLIHHFPCRWDCPATLERANRSLALVAEASPQWADTFRRELRGAVVVENRLAVHQVLGDAGDGEIRFEPHQLRSTSTTPAGRALREAGRLRWSTPLDPHLPHAAGAEAVVVPFA